MLHLLHERVFAKMSDPSTAGNDSPGASMALPPEILLLERADFVGVGMSQMLYGNGIPPPRYLC